MISKSSLWCKNTIAMAVHRMKIINLIYQFFTVSYRSIKGLQLTCSPQCRSSLNVPACMYCHGKGPFSKSLGDPIGQYLNDNKYHVICFYQEILCSTLLIKTLPSHRVLFYHCTLLSMMSSIVVMVIITIVVSVVPVALGWIVIPMPGNESL